MITIRKEDILYKGSVIYTCQRKAYILEQLKILTELGLLIYPDEDIWLTTKERYAAVLLHDNIRINKRIIE